MNILQEYKNEKKYTIVINYTGRKGGGPLDAYEMAKALVELEVDVIAIVSNQVENLDMWRELGLKDLIEVNTYSSIVSYIFSSLLFSFRQKRKIKYLIRNYTIDGIYCPMVTLWSARINRIFKGVKKVAVNHDPIAHSGANKISTYLTERTYKNVDIVVVHTKKFVEYCKDKYKDSVYLPLGRHNMYKNVRDKKTIIHYAEDKLNYVFFGTISDYKGLDVLAEAYKVIEKNYPGQTTLSVIGGGDFSKYEESYSKLQNIQIINRWINDDEVESVFDGENLVCICPYKDATQSGVVLVAYDYGVPVIASDTGGLPEQIVNGQTGLLISPNSVNELVSAMEQFVLHRDLINDMQDHIKFYLEKISWKTIAESLLKLF